MAANFYHYIRNCYWSRFSFPEHGFKFGVSPYSSPIPTIDEAKPCLKSMKIDLREDIFEIPCIYKEIVAETLHKNNTNAIIGADTTDILYIPMFSLYRADNARSSNPFLKSFFYDSRSTYNLTLKSSDNIHYYGGAGLILYDDFTPLVMFTLKVKRVFDYDAPNGKGKVFKYKILGPVIRINPIIYSNTDLLAKYIKTKLIANCFDIPSVYNWLNIRDNYTIFESSNLHLDFKVIIEDFSNFFVTPKVPNVTDNDDSINKMLLDNIDKVLELV